MRCCLILLLTLAGCAEQPTEPPPFRSHGLSDGLI